MLFQIYLTILRLATAAIMLITLGEEDYKTLMVDTGRLLAFMLLLIFFWAIGTWNIKYLAMSVIVCAGMLVSTLVFKFSVADRLAMSVIALAAPIASVAAITVFFGIMAIDAYKHNGRRIPVLTYYAAAFIVAVVLIYPLNLGI